MASNSPSPWLSEEQRARMEQSIGYILRSEISKEGDPRDLSVDDPKRQMEVFDKLSLVLNACRNRLVPINRLPQDIMHHIFSIVLQLEDMHNLEPNPSSSYLVNFIDQRERLRLVSRTWDSFVVSTPSFWSLVDMLAPDIEALSTGVERAGQRELCITHRSGLFTEKYRQRLAVLLTPHLHRVRTLRLRNEGVAAALLKNRFPTLRALELRLNDLWQTQVLPTIIQDHFPQLHTLQLSGCFLPQNTTPLNTLRILRLHDILQAGVVEILAFLAQFSYLEELTILSPNQIPWMGLQSTTAFRLDNLRRLEVRNLDILSLPCLFRHAKIPNFKEVIITFPIEPVHVIGAVLLQCLDALQVLNSSSGSIEIFISDYVVTCVMEDGRSVEVNLTISLPGFSEECTNRFLDHLQPNALRIIVELQHQDRIRWIHRSFDRRNVVELRVRGGILRESRALVDGLAIFGDGEKDTEERFDLELPLPLPSLQTLIFEDSDVDVPHLLRMVTNRATHPQATAATRIKQITLSSCSTRNAPDLSSRFREQGVRLTLR